MIDLGYLGRRWLKFNTVGATGIFVQLTALAVYHSGFGIQYLAATALAVETALLNNFIWHERWTWRDRSRLSPGRRSILMRLLKFNGSNGLVSILVNVGLMRVFVGTFGIYYLLANLMSVAVASIANFLLGELFVYRHRQSDGENTS